MTPTYSTMLFREIYPTHESFVDNYLNSPLCNEKNRISESSTMTLYYLMMERFANNPIINNDVEQFKLKVHSIIFQYGPAWEKKLEIQQVLRNLNEDDLRKGTTQIHNHAFNPSTEPSTASTEELIHVDDQNTGSIKRGKLEAYSQLWVLIETDITKEFLDKFQKLFKQFVRFENPLLYGSEGEDDYDN